MSLTEQPGQRAEEFADAGPGPAWGQRLGQRLGQRFSRLLGGRTLRLHVAPQQLLAVVCQRGRPLHASAVRVDIDNPAGRWQVSVEALRGWLLRSRHAGAGLPLELSVSGRWCQMLLAPWSDALLAEPGAARFLQTQLAALYGEPARAWRIGADDAPYGQPRVVCGMDGDLLAALQEAAADAGLRCHAIEALPGVVLRALPGAAQAFTIVEAGRMTMAALDGRRIVAIQSQPCSGAWRAELAMAWQRWTLHLPELAAVDHVAVVDLSPGTLRLAYAGDEDQLPARFRMADGPFGPAPAPSALQEAA